MRSYVKYTPKKNKPDLNTCGSRSNWIWKKQPPITPSRVTPAFAKTSRHPPKIFVFNLKGKTRLYIGAISDVVQVEKQLTPNIYGSVFVENNEFIPTPTFRICRNGPGFPQTFAANSIYIGTFRQVWLIDPGQRIWPNGSEDKFFHISGVPGSVSKQPGMPFPSWSSRIIWQRCSFPERRRMAGSLVSAFITLFLHGWGFSSLGKNCLRREKDGCIDVMNWTFGGLFLLDFLNESSLIATAWMHRIRGVFESKTNLMNEKWHFISIEIIPIKL